MRFAARFFLVLLLVVCYLLPTNPVFAQTTPQVQNPYAIPVTNPDVPQNMHTFMQSLFIEGLATVSCQLVGIDPLSPSQKCLGIDSKTGKIGFVENGGGLIGLSQNMIAMMFYIPVQTSDFTQYMASNFGVAKPAYAQGVGFNSLKPLVGIWSIFRNLAYMLTVLVFVVVGFAIMLRLKIDARTVMSIENQIPNLIIGIILITFSFAIAGFFVDLMYVILYVSISILSPNDLPTLKIQEHVFSFVNSLYQVNVPGGIRWDTGIWTIIQKPAGSFAAIVTNLLTPFFNGSVLGGIGFSGAIAPIAMRFLVGGITMPIILGKLVCRVPFLGSRFPEWFCGFANAPEAFAIGSIVGIIAFLIIGIAVLWALAKLWFALLNAYIYILLDVATAPLWILTGMLPGGKPGFSGWIRDLIANLSAFPVTIIMFLLGKLFMESFSASNTNVSFSLPLLGGTQPPEILGSFIGLGIIFITPQVVNITRDFLKAPQFKYTAAIGQAIGVGTGAVNVPGQASNLGSTLLGLSHLNSALGGIPILNKILKQQPTH